IRRVYLERSRLSSTSGTICVELVRSLELSGGRVTEVPVHHYPRVHGRSQFFRVRSLAGTFAQVVVLFIRLVLRPSVQRGMMRMRSSQALWPTVIACMLAGLCLLAYVRALQIPLIGDDYLQVHLARQYGPISGWSALAGDPLYRCRATSLLMTYWTERIWGLDGFVFSVSSLVVHLLNCALVCCLGMWRPVGWRLSSAAAALFAASAQHQEAVIWYAALPELLMFFFVMASFLCWVGWVQRRSSFAYIASFGLFLVALLSKESAVAVIPLMAIALACESGSSRWRFGGLAPFGAVALAYFLLALSDREAHLHFRDGTFSLSAPFLTVLRNSVGRLLWAWGFAGLLALACWRAWHWRRVAVIAGAWMCIALLPYSFLTYMPRVPSRHTYLAGVGLALLLGAALLELRQRCRYTSYRWAAACAATVIILQQCAWIWTRKHEQFVLRARPTEELVNLVRSSSGPVYVKCFPYHESIAHYALQYRISPEAVSAVVIGARARARPDAVDLCNAVVGRGSF
ncbi:MAG TPA: hypothetical protein VFL57_05595, partial [Bryobacteraceae bacterium]|nr:hypothetical protein [Bryobacteraceae bacterium]